MKNWMDAAVAEASEGVRAGHGGPFGAVVVQDGTIVGRGHNEVLHRNDPTAHAEVRAIRDACAFLGTYWLNGCVLYTTCEPCPMCLAAIHWARLDEVVYAQTTNDATALGFGDAKFYEAMKKPLMPLTHARNAAAAKLFESYDGERY
jgi:tRNA(Arg) A34 adenosine deaminase TadA